jgi:hypothetical protein
MQSPDVARRTPEADRPSSGIYVCLYPTVKDEAFIYHRCKLLVGGCLPNLHCTIVYSPHKTRNNPNLYMGNTTQYQTEIVDVINLGEYTVCSLKLTDELTYLFDKWVSAGATSVYPDFIPHISIGAVHSDDFTLDELRKVLVGGEITLGRETWILNNVYG